VITGIRREFKCGGNADGIEGARTQVQATKASVENLNLLQQGKGEFAIALGDSVKYAAEGNAEVGFAKPLDKIRGIAAAYSARARRVLHPWPLALTTRAGWASKMKIAVVCDAQCP